MIQIEASIFGAEHEQSMHAVKREQEEMTNKRRFQCKMRDTLPILNSMTYVGCFRLYPHTSMLHRAHTTTTQWCDSVALIWRKCNPAGSTTTTGQGMEHSGSTSANTKYHMHLRLKIYKYMSSLSYFPIVEKQDVRPRCVCRRTIS